MVLDSQINVLRRKFSIRSIEDWRNVTPSEVLSTHNVGPQTLNHLRLHLAGHGVTLRDDETPAFWQSHLYESKIGTVQLSDEDRSVVAPFTILIDAQEKHPFRFEGMLGDSEDEGRPIIARTRVESLGPTHGDYSIDGFDGECHIERKSKEDAIGTILGFGDRRERFERTLEFLSSIWTAAVIVECTIGECLKAVETRGKKTVEENRKILFRSVLAWQIDYTVPWIFCDSRRLAEIATFRIMNRCFHKKLELWKESERKVVNG
jgi:hypothetical protein